MTAGGERIDYGYLIEAHTSGDIYVFFRDSNVLAVGDVASPARDPELDYFTGAWIGGRVDAMDRLLALSDDSTRIVPGFGPVMTAPSCKAERDMMKTIYDRTVDRVREGDYADDMLKAGVLNGLARTWKDPQGSSMTCTKDCGRITTSCRQCGLKMFKNNAISGIGSGRFLSTLPLEFGLALRRWHDDRAAQAALADRIQAGDRARGARADRRRRRREPGATGRHDTAALGRLPVDRELVQIAAAKGARPTPSTATARAR